MFDIVSGMRLVVLRNAQRSVHIYIYSSVLTAQGRRLLMNDMITRNIRQPQFDVYGGVSSD